MVGQKIQRRNGTAVNATCHFGHAYHRFARLAIGSDKCDGCIYFLADPVFVVQFRVDIYRFHCSETVIKIGCI
jgi:hypothetical protein